MAVKCSCDSDSIGFNLNGLKNELNSLDKGPLRCYKCGDLAVVRGRENSCRSCFINVLSRTFRSNFRTKCLEKNDSIRFMAILSQGGLSSTSLLHLILKRNNDRHSKLERGLKGRCGSLFPSLKKLTDSDDMELRVIVEVLSPNDEIDLGKRSNDHLRVICSVIDAFTNQYKVYEEKNCDCLKENKINDLKLCTLKSCYFLHFEGSKFTDRCTDYCTNFFQKFRKMSEEDTDSFIYIWGLLKLMNLRLYLNTISGLPNYLVTPETQEDLCKESLFLTCVGLGNRVVHKNSFSDDISIPGTVIIRPLKTLSSKEIAFYHKFNGLPELTRKTIISSSPSIFSSIHILTEELSYKHTNSLYNISNVTNRLIDPSTKGISGEIISCSFCLQISSEPEQVCRGCGYFIDKWPDEFHYLKKIVEGAILTLTQMRN